MGHEATEVTFRLFVVPQADGQWYAHCVDLTLDALAPTRDEAIRKVEIAISGYVRWALAKKQPLRRPSPWTFRVRHFMYESLDAYRAFRAQRQPQLRQTLLVPQPA